MKRHSDPKAILKERLSAKTLRWGGGRPQTGSQPSAIQNGDDAGQRSNGGVGSPLQLPASAAGVVGVLPRSPETATVSPQALEEGTVKALLDSGGDSQGEPAGRAVALGEHHEGSFGIYMAHKISKLRQQTDGTVPRLQGPEGGLFKGVVAHINGYTKVPVASIREMLNARSGVVEAYNTSKCTHVICESLPYAKIRELRKLRHPPTVVRSAWVVDSVRARRKLPTAEYMVDGVFVQKTTLAAAFGTVAKPSPSTSMPPATDTQHSRRGETRTQTGGTHSQSGKALTESGETSSHSGNESIQYGDGGSQSGKKARTQSGEGHSQSSTARAESSGIHSQSGKMATQPGIVPTKSFQERPNSVRHSPQSQSTQHLSKHQVGESPCEARGQHQAHLRKDRSGVGILPDPGIRQQGKQSNPGESYFSSDGSFPGNQAADRNGSGLVSSWDLSERGGGGGFPVKTTGSRDVQERGTDNTGESSAEGREQHTFRAGHERAAAAAAAGRSNRGSDILVDGMSAPPQGLLDRGGGDDENATQQSRTPGSGPPSTLPTQPLDTTSNGNDCVRPSGNPVSGNAPRAGLEAFPGNNPQNGAGKEAENGLGSGPDHGKSAGSGVGDGDSSVRRPESARAPLPPPFEILGMGAAGEGGRSTKNDPKFMETFFQASRLHYIGVGRARAVKIVNAALAARARPGAAKPMYDGPLGRGESRVILHVDMDCFFVSALIRNRPELRDKALAVAHSASNAKGAGSSEVSSCNYVARAKGVKSGMFMMQAKELCPELIVLRYDFDAYSEASDKMYGIFLRFAPVVMAVSCDEAFLELAEGTDPMVAATEIRRAILKETGCPASAGASNNMLLARMATKQAKPNGQFFLPPELAMRHMGPLPVQDLPGVGWKLRRRLNDEGLNICSDLWSLPLARLQRGLGLGEKTGEALWEACRGIDKRPVQAPPDRKSIGAEVNYGIRFDTQAQADDFLSKLAVELSRRMAAEGVVGRAVTLKLMKQRDGVGLPRKYLGHGICDARSKLLNLKRATASASALTTAALQLLKEAKIPPDKIRGIGLQMTRLDPADTQPTETGIGSSDSGADSGGAGGGGSLHNWLVKAGDESTPGQVVKERGGLGGVSSEAGGYPREETAGAQTMPLYLVNTPATASNVRASVADDLALQQQSVGSGRLRSIAIGGGGGSGGSEGGNGSSPPLIRKNVFGDGYRRAAAPTETSGSGNSGSSDNGAGRGGGMRDSRVRDARGAPSRSSSQLRAAAPEQFETPGPSLPNRRVSSFVLPQSPGVVRTPRVNRSRSSGMQNKKRRVGDGLAARGLAAEDEVPDVSPAHSSCGGDGGARAVAVAGRATGVKRARSVVEEERSAEKDGQTSETSDSSPLLVTPGHRSTDTPMSAAYTPSMSQITFSQIDNTVLGALPVDIRREVVSQLEARQRQREAMNSSNIGGGDHTVDNDAVIASLLSTAGENDGDYSPPKDSASGSGGGERGAGTAPLPAPPAAAADFVVREGLDVNVGDSFGKAQQVSLDSLWTLRKLRDENSEQGSAVKSSVFDRDSLRAMPLGLGLHYASMTEREREQIARRYASAQAMPSSSTHAGRGGGAADDAPGSQAGEHTPCMGTRLGGNIPERSTPNNDASGSLMRDHSVRETSIRDPAAVPRSLPLAPSESGRHIRPFSGAGQSSPFSPPAAFSPNAEQQLHHISLSQVDSDVLNCLPQDVREEVLRAIVASGERSGGREMGHAVAPGGAPPSGDRMNRRDGDQPGQGQEGAGGQSGSSELRQGVDHSESRGIEQHQALVHSRAARERYVCQSESGVDGNNGIEQDDNQRAELGENQTEVDFVDLRSPASPARPARSTEDHALDPGAREGGMHTRVFEFESAGVLRRVLRGWIGGEVASPSQWHLELLYRYLEELVEAGRLDETATLLRCLGRLSSKAEMISPEDQKESDSVEARDTQGSYDTHVEGARTDKGKRIGWSTGYRAVLGAVQELVKLKTGGASLVLCC